MNKISHDEMFGRVMARAFNDEVLKIKAEKEKVAAQDDEDKGFIRRHPVLTGIGLGLGAYGLRKGYKFMKARQGAAGVTNVAHKPASSTGIANAAYRPATSEDIASLKSKYAAMREELAKVAKASTPWGRMDLPSFIKKMHGQTMKKPVPVPVAAPAAPAAKVPYLKHLTQKLKDTVLG
jgi:hypothetical protein